MNGDGNPRVPTFVDRTGEPDMLARAAIFIVAHAAIVAATVAIGTAAQNEPSRIAVVEAGL